MCTSRARIAWNTCMNFMYPACQKEVALNRVELQRDLHMVDINKLDRVGQQYETRIKQAMSRNLRTAALDLLKAQKRNDMKLKQHKALHAACEQMIDRLQIDRDVCATTGALRDATAVAHRGLGDFDGMTSDIDKMVDQMSDLNDASADVRQAMTALGEVPLYGGAEHDADTHSLEYELDAYLREAKADEHPQDVAPSKISNAAPTTVPPSVNYFVLEDDTELPSAPRQIALPVS
ncbi:hypothetical protein CYMTET_6316 [Cymbomonas tetramitiformis]|uniref:Uncharacterized protein n=1 Tax=Cymbomonas tetramitiformis TaxID=36881 RepID=A0AAE0GXM7_9CHLO|nr:hypothetical protein CYMTET_6316 [Cymbomonas tetramitiformis]